MPITQTECDAAKADYKATSDANLAKFNSQVDAMVSGMPPVPTGESPTGTWLPPAAAITDHNGDKWTLDSTPWPQPQYGFKILKNGVWVSGVAVQLAYCGGKLLCFNNQSYFNWNGTTWVPQSAGFCPKTN